MHKGAKPDRNGQRPGDHRKLTATFPLIFHDFVFACPPRITVSGLDDHVTRLLTGGFMNKERRRSPRLSVRVLVRAGWKSAGNAILCDAITVSVNTHGALLKLLTKHPPEDRVVLENMDTGETQEARVVSVASVPKESGAYMVSVELGRPDSEFWRRL
jgi:hypothetical protein